MPSWRCPHCRTPQPEAARCWVCRRSTTCCATCRHFRPAVAGGLGLCGLDRRRGPLRGSEMHACWVAAESAPAAAPAVASPPTAAVHPRSELSFVPLDDLAGRPAPGHEGHATRAAHGFRDDFAVGPADAAPWSLWGDPEG